MCSCQRTFRHLQGDGKNRSLPNCCAEPKLTAHQMMPAGIPLCGTSARQFRFAELVGVTGLEPVTCRLSSGCSNQLSYTPRLRAYALRRGQPDNFNWLAEPKLAAKRRAKAGGADGARTRDPQLAKLVLYQLSYSPTRPDRASAIGSCWWLL